MRLTQIFRQAQKSLIVMNAHAVNRGELPDLQQKDRDFFFLKRSSPDAVAETIEELRPGAPPAQLDGRRTLGRSGSLTHKKI